MNSTNRLRYPASSLASGFFLGCGALVSAQAQSVTNTQPYRLETLIVSADALPVAGNVSASTRIAGAELENRQAFSTRELTALVPNLTTFDANGDRTPRFSLRGLRENNFSYGESALVIYVDDVPYSDLYTRGTPLFDLESAEVLRGPQGTLFGASRPGGVINLLTRLPSNTPQGHGTVRFATANTLSLDGGVSGPIVKDKLFVGVSGLFFDREGYFNNTILGTNPDNRNSLAGRAQLRWTPTESVDVTLSGSAERVRDGAVITRPITAPGDLHDVKMDSDGFNRQDSHTFSLRAAWTGQDVRVVSVTTRRDWRQEVQGDFDFAEYFFNSPVSAITGFGSPDFQQWSQELRVESADKDEALKWNAGGYWAQQTIDHDVGRIYGPEAPRIGIPVPAGTRDQTTSRAVNSTLALFGQATYTVWEKLDLTGGMRFELEERRQSRTRINPLAFPNVVTSWNLDREFASVQPKVGVAWRLNEQISLWFNFSTGFQPGGFSTSEDTAASAAYRDATSLHFEVGTAARFFDGKLTARASAFWIETSDYQVYRPSNAFGDFRIVNADQVRALGGELELIARPCEWFEAALAGGLTHAEFRDFAESAVNNFSGNDVNFIPRFTLDASVTAKHSSGAFATVGVTGVGKYFADEANTVSHPSYAVLRAAIGWKDENFSVSVFGRNLLDKQYYANMTDFGPGGIFGTPGDPMVVGVELTGKF